MGRKWGKSFMEYIYFNERHYYSAPTYRLSHHKAQCIKRLDRNAAWGRANEERFQVLLF